MHHVQTDGDPVNANVTEAKSQTFNEDTYFNVFNSLSLSNKPLICYRRQRSREIIRTIETSSRYIKSATHEYVVCRVATLLHWDSGRIITPRNSLTPHSNITSTVSKLLEVFFNGILFCF